ncbi:hypothetical protein [Thermogutta sp.]|uniref:hypothetical protein n=1 Tax=Thermogutta sp. TaxID=1962930 RepID=UPI003C7BAC35
MNTLLKKLPATSLLFIWVIPTLIICGSAWMTKTVSTRLPSADRLALLFGTNLHIEAVEHPRPGILRLKNVRLVYPGTQVPVFQATSLTLSSYSDQEFWLIENGVITCDGLSFLRQKLEDRIFVLISHHRRVSLSCEELLIQNGRSQQARHGNGSETIFQLAGTPIWTGRLEADLEPALSRIEVRLFESCGRVGVAGAPAPDLTDASDSQTMTTHNKSILEWSLQRTPDGISERLAVNVSLPLSLVETWLPISVSTAHLHCRLAKDGQSRRFQSPTVALAVGQMLPSRESSFLGTIVSTGTLDSPGKTQWHVNVTGEMTWREASLGILGMLGEVSHETGRMKIIRWEAINDRFISGDYLIHLEAGSLRSSQTITTRRLLKWWFSTPSIFDESSSWSSGFRFAEYEIPLARAEADQNQGAGYARALSSFIIDEEQQFRTDESDSASAGDIIPFDCFDLRVVWDADGFQLFPSAESDSLWVIARWQGLPVLALTSEVLGSRIPWSLVLQQVVMMPGNSGSSWER